MNRMRVGDLGFFYHSNCKNAGIVGIVKITGQSTVDPTAYDKKDKHYDPKSDPSSPKWYGVTISYVKHLNTPLELKKDIRTQLASQLPKMILLKQSRLSVQPVSLEEWEILLKASHTKI